MKGRVIHDLQGHIFEMQDYTVSATFPKEECQKKGKLILTRDILSPLTFILVKHTNNNYSYILYANEVYIYGELELLGYKPQQDIRYVKEED